MSADPQFMYTLAGAASTFVAILAGFYTTKIFSIRADINRLKNKDKQIRLEIDWKSQNVNRLREQINSKIDSDNEKDVESFLEDMKLKYSKRIELFDQLTDCYEQYYKQKPSDEIVQKLHERYESFKEEFNNEWDEEQEQESIEEKNNPFYSPLNKKEKQVIISHLDDTSRMIQHNKSMDEENKFHELDKEYEREQSKLDFMKKQSEEYSEEMNALEYPNIKFGFISFAIFAILGVIIPLTSGWWDDYLKEYSDRFAFSMFGIGLLCTFVYLFFEIFIAGKQTHIS